MGVFVMPILGADMKAGELVSWLKKPGDRVRKGDIIAEVDTEKAVAEVEVLMEGVIEKLLVEPGEKLPVGMPLAVIREPGETGPIEIPAGPVVVAQAAMPAVQRPVPRAAAPGARLKVSPSARQLAAELGVDPTHIVGSGPEGRIMRRDIELAAEAEKKAGAPAAPSPEERRLRMRQAISAAMSRSNREIPHFYVASTINMTQATAWLSETNEKRPMPERLIYGVLLLKAVALALKEVPELNAIWSEDRAVLRPSIHVGVAISLRGGGLVAPAIHDTDRLSLAELMTCFRDLVQRARAGRLRSSEMSDPSITVTSLGDEGAETVYGLIYPPQVALVGFGRLTKQPWVQDGQLVLRPAINASLAADHRVVDGHRGSVFLAALERILQDPERL